MTRGTYQCATKVSALALLVGMVFWTTAAAAGDVKITSSGFTYSGMSYFRGNAESVNLASYGEKKTPIGKPNYLSIQNQVGRDKLGKVAVKIGGATPIDWSSYSDADVNLSIEYMTAAGGTAAFSRSAAKSASLVLVKFEISEGPLKTLLNSYADGARTYLKNEGGDGGIASVVWVVMDATLASTITNGGSVSGEASMDGFKVTVGASGSHTTSVTYTIPAGTTFAYLLHKVKKWNGNKIENMEDDQAGIF